MSNYVPPTTPIGQPPQNPMGPPQGYPAQPPQQKSKTWVWVLAGCGTVVILGVIVVAIFAYIAYRKGTQLVDEMDKNPSMTVARMVVAANPNVEMVSVDDDKGVIIVRDKKTGKRLTVNLADARNGKFVLEEEGKEAVTLSAGGDSDSGGLEVKTDKGTVKLGGGSAPQDLPSWLPEYPGAKAEGTYSVRGNEGNAGSFAFSTSDSVETVIAFYERELKSEGLKVNATSSKQGGATVGGVVTGDDKGAGRTVAIILGSKDNGLTQVSVTFEQK